jgi:hypothetical protein
MPDMSESPFITSRAFSIDGIEYSIGVYRYDEGFLAFCDCHQCENHRTTTFF